ncbi:MAG: transglutaminase family protein, partial [Kangiellaceae bacterium]|nr:transglutaminase family protein [Kangiellaceae bacterium]
MQKYLQTTAFFDYNHPNIEQFARQFEDKSYPSRKELAIDLYYSVRDRIAYNPYVFTFDPKTLTASHCLASKESYCIPKAVLLGALARRFGIPSRLGLSDVRNHLSSQKLLDILRSNVFVMHGYIELYIDSNWVKATPAFDANLCDKIGVEPLSFDGEKDSLFQEFNGQGERHMEYVKEHGTFVDVPME